MKFFLGFLVLFGGLTIYPSKALPLRKTSFKKSQAEPITEAPPSTNPPDTSQSTSPADADPDADTEEPTPASNLPIPLQIDVDSSSASKKDLNKVKKTNPKSASDQVTDNMAPLVTGAGAGVPQLVSPLNNEVNDDTFGTVPKVVMAIVTDVAETAIGTLPQYAIPAVYSLTPTAQGTLSSATGQVGSLINNLSSNVSGTVTPLLTNIVDTDSGALPNLVVPVVSTASGTLKELLVPIVTGVSGTAGNVVSNVVSGLGGGAMGLVSKIPNQEILGVVTKLLQVALGVIQSIGKPTAVASVAVKKREDFVARIF